MHALGKCVCLELKASAQYSHAKRQKLQKKKNARLGIRLQLFVFNKISDVHSQSLDTECVSQTNAPKIFYLFYLSSILVHTQCSSAISITRLADADLIVGCEDELEDDEESDQCGLRLEAKRLVQHQLVDEQAEHQETQERVHLQRQAVTTLSINIRGYY